MLLATTSQVSQEIAVVPFLWVLPLVIYLGTFILTFEHERWYHRTYFGLLLGISVILAAAVLLGYVFFPLWAQILIHSIVLFACCMSCHGELYRSRPDQSHLTLFYLVVSVGGALGGLFAAVAAPVIFDDYWEYHVGLIACVLLTQLAWLRGGEQLRGFANRSALALRYLLIVGVLGAIVYTQWYVSGHLVVTSSRNFYGILKVSSYEDEVGEHLLLRHGRIVHGHQYRDPAMSQQPTSYFGPKSAVGLALRHHPRRRGPEGATGLKVGVIGLGIGNVSAYGQAGDTLRYYEINPDVIKFADEMFSYNADTPAVVEVVLGDGRLQLERELREEGPRKFDLLLMDAFSSGSLPIHLITREATEMYWRHLADDGILAFNISNRALDLAPVVRGLAEVCDCEVVRTDAPPDPSRGLSYSRWGMLTANREFLATPQVRDAIVPWDTDRPPLIWTDDFASLWQILVW